MGIPINIHYVHITRGKALIFCKQLIISFKYVLLKGKIYRRRLIVQTAPYLVKPIIFLSPTLKKKFISSPILDFGLWYEILVYRVYKSNAEKIVLSSEVIVFKVFILVFMKLQQLSKVISLNT